MKRKFLSEMAVGGKVYSLLRDQRNRLSGPIWTQTRNKAVRMSA